MPSITFYPEPNVATVAGNVRLGSSSSSTWAAARSDPGFAIGYPLSETVFQSEKNGANFQVFRNIFCFDTSSIPDTDTITSAVFSLCATGSAGSGAETVNPANGALVGATPAGTATFITVDFSTFGLTRFCDTDVLRSDFVIGATYKDWVLNATGLAAVNKTGVTVLGIRASNDFSDSTAPVARTYAQGYYANQTGTSQDPKLVVTYSEAAGNSQTINVILDDITASISQVFRRSQSLAITLDDISVNVNQNLQHAQILSVTLDDITASVSQVSTHPQTISATLDDITVSINQEKAGAKSQTINVTLDDIQANIAQKVSYSQTISATLDDIQVTINQTTANANSQAINVTLDGIQVSVIQTLNHAQSINATLDDIQVNINQAIAINQTINVTLDGISVTINQVSGVIIYGKIDYYVAKPRNMIYVAKPRNYNHIGQ